MLEGRRVHEALRHAQELLGLAARELRGPTASLLRHVRRARRASAGGDGEASSRALDGIDRQARRLATVLEGLVALQELQAATEPVRVRTVDLGAALAAATDARRGAAARAGLTLDLALPSSPVEVSAEPARLAELAGGLVDVALAAAGRGGAVRVLVETQGCGGRALLESRPGPAGTPGRRRASARDPITLALCRALAELLAGTLDVSVRAGVQTLAVGLPGPAARAGPEEPRDAAEGKARLLVVDDDPDAREALLMVLGDDYEVLVAGDGQEALETALVQRPDVVLMDLYMPRMDGLAALEALRSDPLTASVPVILISGRGDDFTRSRSLDLGAVDFLQKPFSARELKARLERTLRLTRRETLLEELARTDALTGLANLRAFRARLDEEVKRARRYRTALACVMVDMDNLKPINDGMGHAAGDVAIATVAEVIRTQLRETDFGARYGGDEFVLLLPHSSVHEARVFAERVAARVRDAHVEVGGMRLHLSASFGIAGMAEEAEEDTAQLLVRRADAALYAAKRAGRGRVVAHGREENPGAQTSASGA